MKSNVTLLRRASSPTFGFGGTAGSRAPLSWIASRPIVGTIGCRSASGAADCGNCGFMVKVSVSLAQVSNSALLPVAPALVLTWMKNCQATLSGSFIAEFASGGAACDHAGFPASSIAPHSRPDAYKLRFITLLLGLSRATVFHPAAIRGTPIGGRAGAPDIAAAVSSMFVFSSPGLAQRMSLRGGGRKSWRQLTGTARSPATGEAYQRLNFKANTGARRNPWRPAGSCESLNARLHAVPHGAEFRKRLRPGVGARHADETDEGAAAEAHPLHQLHRGVGLG